MAETINSKFLNKSGEYSDFHQNWVLRESGIEDDGVFDSVLSQLDESRMPESLKGFLSEWGAEVKDSFSFLQQLDENLASAKYDPLLLTESVEDRIMLEVNDSFLKKPLDTVRRAAALTTIRIEQIKQKLDPKEDLAEVSLEVNSNIEYKIEDNPVLFADTITLEAEKSFPLTLTDQ